MRARLTLLLLLAAGPVAAQKPWEARVDLPVALPVELPAVPPTNPFAATLAAPPTTLATPLQPKFVTLVAAKAAAYVDPNGVCKRAVVVEAPYPGMATALQAALSETSFVPGREYGTAAATWLPVSFDLKGRVEEGRVVSVQAVVPDEATTPSPVVEPIPPADPRDLALPAVAAEKIEQLPTPKRFKLRLDGRTWREDLRFLVEVSDSGRASRIVFLACPQGLRAWMLRSLASWTFRPGQTEAGPVSAWLEVAIAVQVEISDQSSDALRVSRQTLYPRELPAPAGAPLPGA